jgi:hypothetical protein
LSIWAIIAGSWLDFSFATVVEVEKMARISITMSVIDCFILAHFRIKVEK